MKIDKVVGESLKKEFKPIGDTTTAEWLKLAGAEGLKAKPSSTRATKNKPLIKADT